jgi:signal peptidase I
MGLDFELMLVLATLITGVVYVWDRLARRRRGDSGEERARDPWWIDLSRSLFPVILIVLVIRSFIVEPFRIPSGSMIPTLIPGDFILVNKFAYGLRLPVTHDLIFGDGAPERGDVVVFRYPRDESQDYIKRVVGLPGDRIRYQNKRLYINGVLMPQELIGHYGGPGGAEVRSEDLGEVTHPILVFPSSPDRGFVYEVPPEQYFVMGDNRDRSSDSRYWGTVPEENLVGEAFLIWMSWNAAEFSVNWERIGDPIR